METQVQNMCLICILLSKKFNTRVAHADSFRTLTSQILSYFAGGCKRCVPGRKDAKFCTICGCSTKFKICFLGIFRKNRAVTSCQHLKQFIVSYSIEIYTTYSSLAKVYRVVIAFAVDHDLREMFLRFKQNDQFASRVLNFFQK